MPGQLNLYILTHCESCYNRSGIFTGLIDSKLTPNGHRHAVRLARQLKDKQIDVAYTSPQTRTGQTLRHILAYHKDTKVKIEPRLVERDYGALSGKSKAKYAREHPDLFAVYHRSYDVPPPGGESIKQVEARVLPFIKEVIALMKKDKLNVLIVTHGNTLRPIRKYFEGMTNKQMMQTEHFRHRIFRYRIDY